MAAFLNRFIMNNSYQTDRCCMVGCCQCREGIKGNMKDLRHRTWGANSRLWAVWQAYNLMVNTNLKKRTLKIHGLIQTSDLLFPPPNDLKCLPVPDARGYYSDLSTPDSAAHFTIWLPSWLTLLLVSFTLRLFPLQLNRKYHLVTQKGSDTHTHTLSTPTNDQTNKLFANKQCGKILKLLLTV